MDLESIFKAAHLKIKPRDPVPRIKVEFFPFAGLSHTARLQGNILTIRMSDAFVDAPRDVCESLAWILLSKLYGKRAGPTYHRTYRLFTLTEEIREKARRIRVSRGRVHAVKSLGKYVDLGRVFDRLNEQYFRGLLEKPRLSWTPRKSRTVLGRFEAIHNTIFISRIFDSIHVPSYVIDYILFHELLHLKHQSRVKNSRMVVHTPEFRREEHRFEKYLEAQHWLEKIWDTSALNVDEQLSTPNPLSTEAVEKPVEKGQSEGLKRP